MMTINTSECIGTSRSIDNHTCRNKGELKIKKKVRYRLNRLIDQRCHEKTSERRSQKTNIWSGHGLRAGSTIEDQEYGSHHLRT